MRITVVLFAAASILSAQSRGPVRAITDPGVITTRQGITPAGLPAVFDGRVLGVAFGHDAGEIWVANSTHLYRLDWKSNRTIETRPILGAPGLQGIRFDTAANRPLLTAALRVSGGRARVELLTSPSGSGKLSAIGESVGTTLAGALAIAPENDAQGRRLAVISLTANNGLAVIDLTRSAFVGKAPTGIAPFGAVISHNSSIAFVSNWGGRVPRAGARAAPAGAQPDDDQVAVDERGVASSGTVTRIDFATMKATDEIPVGLHPTALAWDESRQRLYVANGNSDSISEIDTVHMTETRTFTLAPFAVRAAGIAPTALVLSRDGSVLYAACGGINAIEVIDTRTGASKGLIPTAWYPNGLALSPDGQWLAVSALLGAGPGWRDSPSKRYVHADRASVAVLPVPDAPQLASYSTAVAENNHLQLAGASLPRAATPSTVATPLPARSGEPSSIEHVVLIVKENRSYDQVFGDMTKGNGDPSLVMFGRDVTPNQHKLADEFTLFDNFYATGGNSADGHQWITQANETNYALWPGYEDRSYPFDGTDPIAYSKNGFLWDYALARVNQFEFTASMRATPQCPARSASSTDALEKWRRFHAGMDDEGSHCTA